ncbi:elongation factor P hydroxylase [Candidatus Pelagadaptatus aseana]|uniref:elongation factor P hydroxylase n=1 Tax=Candidatus Pelagadaptatus aseana TaxID=3120508 RepID=UPI003C6F6639
MTSLQVPTFRTLDHRALIEVFNQTFELSHNTVLVGGAEEPIYLPADDSHRQHRIIFTRDYGASALHEVAHWLVAGPERRLQEDYGYWYAPDGRTQAQQDEFERVEIRPQAIEWLLSVAAGRRFRVSADNLQAGLGASDEFKNNIYQQVLTFIDQGVSDRLQRLIGALEKASGRTVTFTPGHYCLGAL